MFVDHATIQIQSGAGGNGMVAWRREKYVPFGGPAGGHGGLGGSVYLKASLDLSTLLDFRYQALYKAEDGEKGGIKNCQGKMGKDLIILVPCGTIVFDADTNAAIADLTNPGDEVMVATGGRGGRGNSSFSSSRRQSPQYAEPGEPGIERSIRLELKLIAEVGIIGLPNAGKSTLISVISAAKPKIANYPFTTLVPNLGVVRKPNGDGLVVADIPGLVEGASDGIGLGHEFLRHVERTRLLLHLVDATEIDENLEPLGMQQFDLINAELQKYSPRLAKKPQIVILSKQDAADPETIETLLTELKNRGIAEIFVISAATRQGIEPLMHRVLEQLESLPEDTAVVEIVPDPKATDNDDSGFFINRRSKAFYVECGKIDRLFSVTDFRNREAAQRLLNILRAMGIYKALDKAGVREGHTVHMGGMEFDYFSELEERNSSDTTASSRVARSFLAPRAKEETIPAFELDDSEANDDWDRDDLDSAPKENNEELLSL